MVFVASSSQSRSASSAIRSTTLKNFTASLVAQSLALPVSQEFVPEAGSGYSVLLRLHATSEMEFVYIKGKDGKVVVGFSCTNGVYYPVDKQLIVERNEEIERARENIKLSEFLIAQ